MEYVVSEINNGVGKIVFSDGGWTFVELWSDMTEEDVDDLVYRITPPHLKQGETPSFLSAGVTRTAQERVYEEPTDDRPAWLIARMDAYGSLTDQIEYITENGLEAWQTHVAEIKAANPKIAE